MTQEKKIEKKKELDIKPGMVVRVHETIKEKNAKGEEKQRVQVFEGIVIARKHGKELGATITVRKLSDGVGVEKIYPISSPLIDKIEIKSRIKSNKAKLYYLRSYKKRLKKVAV
jgi:large subunit ribosomal protein L19